MNIGISDGLEFKVKVWACQGVGRATMSLFVRGSLIPETTDLGGRE
jgi:hypothetical protein